MLSPYSFSKETQGCNLSRNQENESTEDVYNHLHEQHENDDETYDHACAAPNYSTDISDYSNLCDTATIQPSPSKDEDYSTLRHWISKDCQYVYKWVNCNNLLALHLLFKKMKLSAFWGYGLWKMLLSIIHKQICQWTRH